MPAITNKFPDFKVRRRRAVDDEQPFEQSNSTKDTKVFRRNAVQEGMIYRDVLLHEDDCKVLQKFKGHVVVYWLKLRRVSQVKWYVFDRFKQVGDADEKCPQLNTWLKRLKNKDEQAGTRGRGVGRRVRS